jgi:thymidylate kinase
MLINIRGTNGAGKTSVILELFTKCKPQPIYGVLGSRLPEAYKLKFPNCETVFVLGPYTAQCGGCDRIQPYDLIPSLIEKYAEQGHMVFEGILISGCWGVIGRLLERWKRDAIIVFLDTPVDQCIRRIRTRRLERGDEREFDPRNLIQKHTTVVRLRQKIIAAGIVRTQTVSCENAASVIVNLLAQRPTQALREYV